MGYETTQLAASMLNLELQSRHEAGNSPQLKVDGRPQLRIISFVPLAYETYGTFRNRAPQVAGLLSLRAILT